MTEKLKELAREMSGLTTYEQTSIIDRFVARQKNAELMKQIKEDRENRIAMILIQRGYKPHEVGL